MELEFFIIDAFTSQRFEGAQVAVFPQAEGLSAEQMQRLAREMNLTESIFILAPENKNSLAAIRLFSPQQEVFYAGHPVIAALYAMHIRQPIVGKDYQLEVAGRELAIEVKGTGNDIKIHYICAEAIRMDSYVPSARELAEFLNLEEKSIQQEYAPMLVSRGEDYLMVPVKDQQALRSASFNQNKWLMSFVASLASKIFVFCEADDTDADYCGRLLGKDIADHEDPPVGPAAPAFAAYLMHDKAEGKRSAILQRGGGELRKSLLHLEIEKTADATPLIKVGGSAVLMARGTIEI